MKRVALGLLGFIVLLVVAAVGFLYLARPLVRPASTEKFEVTPERLARGKYLVHHAVDCIGCHSEFDEKLYGLYPKEGTEGGGGSCFTKESVGFPGIVCAKNITPDVETGIGSWTDGEIVRAFREGIGRDGRLMVPAMPYKLFRKLSDEDSKAIVVYLRTLPPLKKTFPETQVDFPMNLLMRLAPQPVEEPVATPDPNDQLATGKYLSWACYDCHTPVDGKMESIADKAFAGGREFSYNGLVIRTPNLTSHPTGLGGKTEEEFVGMFKAFAGKPKIHIADWKDNTFMPWIALGGVEERDLRAIYAYLKSVPPQDNAVERRPMPSIPAAPAAAPAGSPQATPPAP